MDAYALDAPATIYTLAQLEDMSPGELQQVYREFPMSLKMEGQIPTHRMEDWVLPATLVRLEGSAYAEGLYDDIPGVERYTSSELTSMDRSEQERIFAELEHLTAPMEDPDYIVGYILMGQTADFMQKVRTEDEFQPMKRR
ncbi:MAG: hypothetical protein QF415_07550 [Candidatus Undinarchaeales archaeon]|jgi:hypothetical protein|nr:hypothetical protein [Candidatus Undinarchaeales archaeon]MDP7492319.1 hypothetical protein [Candidatus Undinarchaeales archaeon]